MKPGYMYNIVRVSRRGKVWYEVEQCERGTATWGTVGVEFATQEDAEGWVEYQLSKEVREVVRVYL